MGRRAKVQPGQVKDFLQENGNAITVAEIAKYFGICEETVRRLLRILRKEGNPIIPTREGILNCQEIKDEGDASLVKDYGVWLMALLVSLSQYASISKRPLIQARKMLELEEDRKKIRETLVMLTRVIDIIDIDHQLSD
jgi:DNA-binding Lrp family transcriptional regulator